MLLYSNINVLFVVLLYMWFSYALFGLDGIACHILRLRGSERKSGKGSPYLLKTTLKKISTYHITPHSVALFNGFERV